MLGRIRSLGLGRLIMVGDFTTESLGLQLEKENDRRQYNVLNDFFY